MSISEKKNKTVMDAKDGFDFICELWREYGETFLKKRVYCVYAAIKTSKTTGRPYALFYLKDAKGMPFSAFLFNLGEDLEGVAAKITNFRGKFLEVSGEVDNYNGDITFSLFEVNVTDKLGELGSFLGTEKRAMEFLDTFDKQVTKVMQGVEKADVRWAMASLPRVIDGKLGAFSRLAVEMQEDLFKFFEMASLEQVTQEVWLVTLRRTLAHMFDFYNTPDTNVALNAQKLLVLGKIVEREAEEIQELLTDTLLGVLGIMEPETVLGNLIKDSVQNFNKRNNLVDAHRVLLFGHSKRVGDAKLKALV